MKVSQAHEEPHSSDQGMFNVHKICNCLQNSGFEFEACLFKKTKTILLLVPFGPFPPKVTGGVIASISPPVATPADIWPNITLNDCGT